MTATVTDLADARLDRVRQSTADRDALIESARHLEVYAAMQGHCDARADIKAHAQALREMAAKLARETSGESR